MEPYAVLDIGTNSVKILVAKKNDAGSFSVLYDRSLIVRLGEGISTTQRLGEIPMERALDAISSLVDEARALGAREIRAVGTEALRIAQNAHAFVAKVKERLGVDVEIISGEEEARFSYRAAVSRVDTNQNVVLVFDVGGGSTELIKGCCGEPTERVSVPLGALNLHDNFFAGHSQIDSEQLNRARRFILEGLQRVNPIACSVPKETPLIGIGGTITTLLRVLMQASKQSAPALQGRLLTRSEVGEMVALFARTPLAERKNILGLEEKRSEIILAGACLVECFLESIGRSSFLISDRGLRYGLFETIVKEKIC